MMSSGSFWGIIAISGCIGLSVLYWTRVYIVCALPLEDLEIDQDIEREW
jgi:hypothetical protein